jgi:hypothetical protein
MFIQKHIIQNLTFIIEKRDDWFTASCLEMKDFCMSWTNYQELIDDIPNALKAMRRFKLNG